MMVPVFVAVGIVEQAAGLWQRLRLARLYLPNADAPLPAADVPFDCVLLDRNGVVKKYQLRE
jgi:hypothetical protein